MPMSTQRGSTPTMGATPDPELISKAKADDKLSAFVPVPNPRLDGRENANEATATQ